MKTTNLLLLFVLFISTVIFLSSGCTEHVLDRPAPEIKVISEEVAGQEPTILDNITATSYPVDYAAGQEKFDWENLESLPLPPNNNLVPMPWSDKAKRHFSDDIRYDYKKSDGWELYLSTFSTKFRQGPLTFSLYNKW